MRARSAHMILAVIVAVAAIVPLACKAPDALRGKKSRNRSGYFL